MLDVSKMTPLDLASIQEMGVEEWAEKVPWPFSDKQFDKLSDIVFDSFDSVYKTLNAKRRAIFLASMSHVAGLIQDLHLEILDAQVNASGRSLTWSGRASGKPYRQFVIDRGVKLDAKTVWATRARQLVKNVVFNRGQITRPVSFCNDYNQTWSLGSFSRLKSDYLDKRGSGCRHVYPATLLVKSTHNASSVPDIVVEAGVQRVIDLVQMRVKTDFKINVDLSDVEFRWFDDLIVFGTIYDKILCLRDIPKTLLLSEMGYPAHKLIASALRSRGTSVVGFHHGSNIGLFAPRTFPYVELLHCDRYVCPTAEIAKLYQRKLDLLDMIENDHVTFESADSDQFCKFMSQELPVAGHQHQVPKTVMVMGYTYQNFRYLYNPACYLIFQLQAQLKLLQTLQNAGYRVIFKTHPESTPLIDEIMRPYCDKVERHPFEQVVDDADVFVFSYVATTTFAHALCQNKPVIALDPPYDKWVPEARKLIEQRCHLVSTFWGEDGKIDFDKNTLLAALKNPKSIDLDGIFNVMMPIVGRID